MRFYNRPRFVERKCYDDVLEAVVARLRLEPGVIAVYQLGGTSAPGISDVDVLAVFEDGARCTIDARDGLDGTGRYLFTHGLFGVSRSLLNDALRYGAYAGLRLLDGQDLVPAPSPPPDTQNAIDRQTALEFLLMNYIARVVDTQYGVASLRNVLLSTHAIRFDLDLLGVTASPLRGYLAQVGEWRQRWFTHPVPDGELRAWWRAFVPALGQLVAEELNAAPLMLPQRHCDRLARHIRIRASAPLGIAHRGLTLPAALTTWGKRFVRLQNRVNRFDVTVPAVAAATGSEMDRRFEFFRLMRVDAASHYPAFTPLLNNLAAKVI